VRACVGVSERERGRESVGEREGERDFITSFSGSVMISFYFDGRLSLRFIIARFCIFPFSLSLSLSLFPPPVKVQVKRNAQNWTLTLFFRTNERTKAFQSSLSDVAVDGDDVGFVLFSFLSLFPCDDASINFLDFFILSRTNKRGRGGHVEMG